MRRTGGRQSSRFAPLRPAFWTTARSWRTTPAGAGPPPFTPPTELEGYADWLVRCGKVREHWRAMHEDTDTWQPHLDRLKDEAGEDRGRRATV